jgi:transposase-like protein
MTNHAQVLKKRKNDLSIREFQEYFRDEQACHDYLFRLKWPNGFHCPQCGHPSAYITKRGRFQCKQCKHQSSTTAGTLFHKTHLKLHLWFWAIYLFSRDKRGCSAVAMKNALNVSYPTAWLLLQKIRTAMMSKNDEYLLSGVVLIDETYFGGKKDSAKPGRGCKRTPALISLSATPTGKPLFAHISLLKDCQQKTIDEVAKKTIESGSLLISDSDRALKSLEGYDHLLVNFRQDKVSTLQVLKWVHTLISNLKASLLATYHRPSDKHLQRYLAEFCYRFNRRFCEPLIFEKLVRACALAPPSPYADLTL